MKIIKRNGSEAVFDIMKIISAVTRANNVVEEADRLTPMQIRRIAESVELSCQSMNRALSVEEIQDLVEHQIMAHGAYEVAKNYITYRYTRSLVRKSNTTDDKILTLIESNNEEVKQENANKNPTVNAVCRASTWRSICRRARRSFISSATARRPRRTSAGRASRPRASTSVQTSSSSP